MRTISVLSDLVKNEELLGVAHRAIEDKLVTLRDSRTSLLFCSNGLVIREKDGSSSDIIRLSPKNAMKIGLQAIVDHFFERQNEQLQSEIHVDILRLGRQ